MTFCEWIYPKRPFVLCNSFIYPDVSKGDTCKAVYAKVMLRFKEEQQKAAAKPEAPIAEVKRAPKVGKAQAQPSPTLWKCILQHGLEIRPRATFARGECQGKVHHGQVFEVEEERAFYKGNGYFLRLPHNRGWVFSSSDRLGTCCERAGQHEQPTSPVQGGWENGASRKQQNGEGHSAWWNGTRDEGEWKKPQCDEVSTSWWWKADEESWQSDKGQSAWSQTRPSDWWEPSSSSTQGWQWNQREYEW